MTIAISGASGFIGQHLCRRLLEDGIPFICITRASTDHSFFEKNKIQCISFDGQGLTLENAFRLHQVNGVVHLATHFVAEHEHQHIHNMVMSNILYGTYLLEASARAGSKWFLNTGTFWQHFDGAEYNPVNLYAATKKALEDIAKFYAEAYSLRFCTLKLPDTYGPGDRRQKIFNLFEKFCASGEVLEMSPGDQLIDLIHVDQVIAAFILLIDRLNSSVKVVENCESYFISSGRKVSLRDLAREYEHANNVRLNIRWGARPYRKREVMDPSCIGIDLSRINF